MNCPRLGSEQGSKIFTVIVENNKIRRREGEMKERRCNLKSILQQFVVFSYYIFDESGAEVVVKRTRINS